MSIDKVASSHIRSRAESYSQHYEQQYQSPLGDARVGQEVSLRILSKLAPDRYLASVGDAKIVVASQIPFAIGQTVKTTVNSIDGVVELKYLGDGQFELVKSESSSKESSAAIPGGAFLSNLQTKYKTFLSAADAQLIESLSAGISRPTEFAAGGLYLNKIRAQISDDELNALYASQIWQDEKESDVDSTANLMDVSALVVGVQQGRRADIDALAKILGDVAEQSTSTQEAQESSGEEARGVALNLPTTDLANGKGANATTDDDDEIRKLAQRLLNSQDSGAIAYHYGSMPVLISGQLVELDVLLFRERESAQQNAGLRKLVMTLNTESLGRVEIVAQSIDNHLSVSITTQSPQATEKLAGHVTEVRDLVTQLGWRVDGVSYRLASDPQRAANQIICHVLNSGTLNSMV